MTSKQAKVLNFIINFKKENNGASPSYDEIAKYFQYKTRSAVVTFINDLEKRGYIKIPKHDSGKRFHREIDILRYD